MSAIDDIPPADLAPDRVRAFLVASGWTLLEDRRTGTLWSRADDETKPTVFLPRQGTENYDRRMRELLRDLGEIVGGAPEIVARRYEEAARDLIRLRVVAAESAKGELPFNYARRMFDALHALVAAGARSAHTPVAAFPRGSKVRIVESFLDNLMLGQTAEGSFVVQLLSPIGGEWQLSALTDRDIGESDIPFERLATMRLADGVAAAKNIAELSTVGLEDSPELDRAVEHGLSANLCQALAQLSTDEVPATIEMQIAWASLRRMPEAVSAITIPTAELRRLDHVADVLSERKPIADFPLTGLISSVQRVRTLDNGGRIIVNSEDLPGRGRTVHIDLDDDAMFDRAIVAFADNQPASFVGTLHYGGSKWLLLDAEMR